MPLGRMFAKEGNHVSPAASHTSASRRTPVFRIARPQPSHCAARKLDWRCGCEATSLYYLQGAVSHLGKGDIIIPYPYIVLWNGVALPCYRRLEAHRGFLATVPIYCDATDCRDVAVYLRSSNPHGSARCCEGAKRNCPCIGVEHV